MNVRSSLLIVALVLASVGPPAAMQQAGRTVDALLTAGGQEQALARGESHDWRIDLDTGEYVEIAIHVIGLAEKDNWPVVTMTAPTGAVLRESTGPSVIPSIDHEGLVIVSFVTDGPGTYVLRVSLGASNVSTVRYRARLAARRPAVDADRDRLAAHALWRDAGDSFNEGSPASLRLAAAKYGEALALLEKVDDDEARAMTLGTMAAAWYFLSDAPQGTAAATRALEIWRRLGRGREEAVALSDLGVLAYLAYDHATARSYYDQALAGHRAASDVLGEARTLTRVGWVHYAAAELQEVIDINRQALALYRAAGDPSGESIAFNDLGRAHLDVGDVSLALEAFEQAAALRPPDRHPRGAANVRIRMGMAYLAVAEWQRALDALHQALDLSRVSKDERTEVGTLVNLGSAYVTFGDTSEGFRYLEPALTQARAIGFRNAESYALLWLGIGASLNGEPERSRDYLQQAVAIQTGIKDVRGLATTLRQLAAVQLELGSARDALDSITRSIQVSPDASGLVYSGDLTLANVTAALGDTSRAQALYEEALARLRGIRARHAEALTLNRYGTFLAKEGRFPEARDRLAEALDIHESLRGLIVDPDLRMSYTSTSLGPYQAYIDVLMEMERRSPGIGFAAQAFHANERARARGLLEMLATSGVDIREGVDEALVARERSLRWSLNAKAAIQTSLLARKGNARRLAALEKEIADLSQEFRETTTRIRQQSPAYASLTDPQPLTADEVSRLLDPGTVLLEFAPGESRSWLFAVTDAGLESFALPSRRAIEETARDVHRLMTARQPVSGESASERAARIRRADAALADRTRTLSDLVLAPIGGKLANEWRDRRLAIVASGALEYVPFAVLPVPGTSGAPLVAAHEIVTLPSASSLALLRRPRGPRPSVQKTIAIFADPVFGADDPRVRTGRADERQPLPASATLTQGAQAQSSAPAFVTRALDPFRAGGALARLPFSRAEAAAVASQVPRASILQATDFNASLALATSGRLNDYRIVHFATHGLINASRPELSGLALSLVDQQGRARDGFLRLNTIYNLRLSADLVVLSACQSALGKEVAGEGLVGLTRGFMYAGAKGVIASLWQVSDVATAELMKRFYEGMLRRQLSPAAALRRAQLEMARDARWASPYFWAGFVLQGDWKS